MALLAFTPLMLGARMAPAQGGTATAGVAADRLSLAEAVARAMAEESGVRLAELSVEESEARVDVARAALLPRMSASAMTANRTFNLYSMGFSLPRAPGEPPLPALVGPFANVDARVHLNQALFDPASYRRMRAASVAVGTDEARYAEVRAEAAHEAALAYLDAWRADAVLQARRADAELAAELLDLAERQLEAGVSTHIDVTRARTQQVAAAGAVLVAENAATQAQIDLARAIGADPASRFVLGPPFAEIGALVDRLPTDRAQLLGLALRQRPELQSARAMREAAEATRRSIRAERLPRVDLFADYGVSGLHVDDAIATRQIGVQVSIPLLDGLGRESRIAEQSAAVRAAAVLADEAVDQVTAEVDAAMLDLQTGQQRWRIAEERLGLAEEELAQARERFENGVAGNFELIQAQLSLNAARDAEIEARYDIAAAQASLAKAVGVLTDLASDQ